ncbi:toxin-antitoxin system HicB family antitoxin [Streptomyces sp. NPDC048172]|uniref:toxin-antitoxin system HicB family antitoxin n=1 Tax=Streptomyces sp. NPDC048172 TaxID=3365505 RepID=UPI00371B8C8F
MDLTPYVDNLRRELAVAAEAGGEDARALAERLAAPLESATRLALLNVLSDAMGEITRELAPGSVDVRLRGLDPDFVVTAPPGGEGEGSAGEPGTAPAASASAAASAAMAADEGGTSRINLRLPAQLKVRAEEAATREGLSLNAWLVRALSSALDPEGGAARRETGPGGSSGRAGRGKQSLTGWVR